MFEYLHRIRLVLGSIGHHSLGQLVCGDGEVLGLVDDASDATHELLAGAGFLGGIAETRVAVENKY